MSAHDIEYEIHGSDIQIVDIILDPGETVIAEAGAMLAMDGDIEMKTSAFSGSKGFLNAGKRLLSGENLFYTSFTNKGQTKAKVTFSTPYIGKIVPLDLKEINMPFLCNRGAFLCAAKGIDITVGFQRRIRVGIFGNTGFILQKLKGNGLVFLHSGGNLYKRILRPGEVIYVDSEALIGFNEGIDFNLTFVKGIRNMLFGGEGLFLYKIKGPGIVLAQSFNFQNWMKENKNETKVTIEKS